MILEFDWVWLMYNNNEPGVTWWWTHTFQVIFLQISSKHEKALGITSIIGCSVSLVSVIVTISVILVTWRKLKRPRIIYIVRVNLCVAIGGSCLLVIVGEVSSLDFSVRKSKIVWVFLLNSVLSGFQLLRTNKIESSNNIGFILWTRWYCQSVWKEKIRFNLFQPNINLV